MKNAIRNISVLLILIIHVALLGQNATPQLFEPTIIKADIDTLISKLKDVHPTFLAHYNTNDFKTKIDSIKNNITKPMSSLDFFRIMQPIVSIDGHTSLIYNGPLCPNEDNPVFPFRVIVFNNSLYIKENLTENKTLVKGSVIEKINGVSSEDIIRNLIRYIPGEKETYKTKRLEKDLYIYLALVYGSFSDFNITVDKSELKLKGVKWDEYQEPSKPKFELRFYDNDIAYINKKMYMPPKDFIHFMDSAFTVISEKQIDYLIIDNLSGSGLSDLADSLMSYFTAEPYSMLEKKMTKISPLTKEFIENKKSEGFIKDGHFIQEYQKHPSVRVNQFSGSTYILTGPSTYSTGTCFSAAAKCYHNAFIVGQESGQPLLSNGDRNQFELPETKILCITALSTVYMPCNNNDEVNGVLPDYKVTPTLEDLLDDKEYTLEYTLKLIRENKIKKENVIGDKGYYYNQTPPGDSAVIFAPGIFSLPDRLESNIALSTDGKECYFGVLEIKDRKVSYKIYQSKFANNKWTEQTEAPFSLNNNIGDPILSADGKKLYFNKEGDIWMIERSSEKWGIPKKLPSPINSNAYEGYITESADGVIYISSKRPEGFGGIDNWRINRLPDQSLQEENLGPIFNTSLFDYSPFIAPDGSYLIFGSYRARRDGLLYISFNKGNDEWTTPINMNSCGAKVNNTTAHHSNPSLSPDGKFLFFRRHEADTVMNVYWVSTGILKKLKEKAMQESFPQKITDLKGDYLGQQLPGDIPVVFAHGIISTDSTIEHGSPTFSPDGNEVYWQSNLRHKGKETKIFLKTMRRLEDQWTAPVPSSYGGMPAFSPDGNKLYFISDETEEAKGLYFIEKQGENWSEPKSLNLIARFPELKYLYGPSITSNGTLYFFGHAEGLESMNNFGIYRSEFINGNYVKPELLPASINAAEGALNWTPFIAPDESYLLFSSNRLNNQQDIFISFRQSDGTWTEAHNLGEAINTNRGERFPSVSPDGKYLFFTRWVASGNEDAMWVSANIIDEIKEGVFNPKKMRK